MMKGISKEIHGGQEVLVADFSDCKESQMIELLIEFRNLLIAEHKPQLLLGIFDNKNFFTSKFMKAFRSEKRLEVIPFMKKQAVVGLSDTKKIILMGFNLLFNRNIRAFDSKESAIKYLISNDLN